jgi:hypothetical protein
MHDGIVKGLKAEALFIAKNLSGREKELEKQLHELDQQRTTLEAQLDVARDAHKRAAEYAPMIGRDLLCPRCWINGEARATLRSVQGSDEADYFRCNLCDRTFEFPIER